MKFLKIAIAAVLVLLCLVSVWAGREFFFPQARFTEGAMDILRATGDREALVWIVEYVDYQCESCRVASALLEKAIEAFPSKIYLQARFFPLRKHKHALKAAIYAHAAAEQDRFWPFHKILFERQTEWIHAPEESIDALFGKYAAEAGLDGKRLAASVGDRSTKEKVWEEIENAKSLGVRITPTFFVNGKMTAGLKALKEALKTMPDLTVEPARS